MLYAGDPFAPRFQIRRFGFGAAERLTERRPPLLFRGEWERGVRAPAGQDVAEHGEAAPHIASEEQTVRDQFHAGLRPMFGIVCERLVLAERHGRCTSD